MTSPAGDPMRRVAHCSACGREWEPTVEAPACHVLNPGDHQTTLLCQTCSGDHALKALGLSHLVSLRKDEEPKQS